MGRRTLPPAPAGSGARRAAEQNRCRSGRAWRSIGAFDRRCELVDDVPRGSSRRRMQEILGDELLALRRGSYALALRARRSDASSRGRVEPLATPSSERIERVDALPRGRAGRARATREARAHRALRQRRCCPADSARRPGARRERAERRASSSTSSTGADMRASAPTSSPATSRASGSRSTARSCASTAGRSHGPPAVELLAPIARGACSRRCSRESIALAPRRRLDATRARHGAARSHFLDTGHWISKLERVAA